MADPTDRLAAFADGGDPLPLAPAEAVRARGEQRRRHGRTALGLTGAAVLLAAGAAFGLGGSTDTSDSLGPAERPTSSPSEPAPEPSSEASDVEQEPDTGTAVPDDPMLRPEDAAAVRAGTWTASALAPGSLLDPCGGTEYPQDARRQDVGYRALTHADGQRLRQMVAHYDSESSAAAAVLGFRNAVAGCPSRVLSEPRATPPFQRVHQMAGEPGIQRFGDEALFVDAGTGCDTEQQCDQDAVRYAVVRTQRAVAVLELSSTRRSDLRTADVHQLAEQLAELTHAALRRVQCSLAGRCDGPAYAPSDFPRPAVLTHGGDAWAVFLAVSERDGTAELAAADSAAREIGYGNTLSGPYSCDVGAKEGLGYSEDQELFVSLLYFDTATTAARFVEAYDGNVVKTLKVQTLCLD